MARTQAYTDAEGTERVSGSQSVARMEFDAWELAEAEVKALPPYLGEDDLTAERLYAKHKDTISKQDAQAILDKLAEDGRLVKVERRNPKGGSHVWAYQTA